MINETTLPSNDRENKDNEGVAPEIDFAIKLETNLVEGDVSEFVVRNSRWFYQVKQFSFYRRRDLNRNWTMKIVHPRNMTSTKM